MPINSPLKPGNAVTGCTLVLLGALGYSAKSILVKLAYLAAPQVDALSLMALRMAFSLPLLLPIIVWHQRNNSAPPLLASQWLAVIVLGLMGYYLAGYLDFSGLLYITAGLERVILFLYPTFVVLFSAVLYRRKISAWETFALILSYAGLLLIFAGQFSTASSRLVTGSALVLCSAVVFACFTMGSGVMVHRIGSSRFTAYTMAVAGIATLMHFAFVHKTGFNGFPSDIYLPTLLMAVFSTVLPAFFMNAGIRRIGAGPASVISTTGPVITLVLAYLLLNETITLLQLAGTALVLAGVYAVNRR